MSLKDFSLSGKTILVTGASSGIGNVAAIQASEHGARVVITGRNEERLNKTAERLLNQDLKHKAIVADFSQISDVANFVDSIKNLGDVSGFDGVIHSAGISFLSPIKLLSYEFLRKHQFINFEVPVFLMKELINSKMIKEKASIVFLSSFGTFWGIKCGGAYAASKGALEAVARNMAAELVSRKIRVNCLAPGMIKTPMAMSNTNSLSPEQIAADQLRYPLGWGEPEDVSNAIMFFLSDASKWITGSTLNMDGGVSLG